MPKEIRIRSSRSIYQLVQPTSLIELSRTLRSTRIMKRALSFEVEILQAIFNLIPGCGQIMSKLCNHKTRPIRCVCNILGI